MHKHIINYWWIYIGILIIGSLSYYHLSHTKTKAIEEDTSAGDHLALQQAHNTHTTMEQYTTTASGLKYKIVREGEGGDKPHHESTVTVHYHGTLTDGTVFDSSRERGETTSFGLRQVIPGWTEGLQLMSVGDVYEFYIPAELAYGDRSPSPLIPAGSDLVFEVELFNISN